MTLRYTRTTRSWNRDQFPPADHELTDTEIEARYAPTIEGFVVDIATDAKFHSLTQMARAGEEIVKRRAKRR